jgi:CHAD domain-containing protein
MPEFLVPEGTDLAELAARLEAWGGLEPGPTSTIERTFYDTFDWRLWRAGSTLVGEPRGRRLLLRLEPRDEQATPAGRRPKTAPAPASVEMPCRQRRLTTRTAEAPRFVGELPPGALRRCLERIVEMRALLPQASVRTASRQLGQRDAHGKLLLRLALEEHQLLSPEGERSAGVRLRLSPLRGYAKAARLARLRLERELGLVATGEELLPSLLRMLERELADPSAKLAPRLEPTMPAAEAMRLVLQELCRTMRANLDGMLRDVDSEFLHDFRVAVRRTRTALGRMRAVLPIGSVRLFRAGFRWLSQLTGGARDLDVYLLHFDEYRDLLPEPLHQPFELLRGFLAAKREEHRRELCQGIESARGRKLLAHWSELLTQPAPERSRAPRARRPIAQVAREELWRSYRKTIALGRAIHDQSPPSELHELRKTCKKLRYLIEFFRSLLPADDAARLVDELKGLQQILGEVQDLEVQTATLMRYSAEMSRERDVPPATLMAVGALVEQLRQRQLGARQQFATAFGRFSRPELRQLGRDSFKPARAGDRRALGARRGGAR